MEGWSDPNQIAGVETAEGVNKHSWLRDDSTFGKLIYKGVIQGDIGPYLFISACVLSLVLPGPWEIYSLLTVIYGFMILSSQASYPTMPHLLPHVHKGDYDLRLPIPGTGRRKFEKPKGILLGGRERRSFKQVWFSFTEFLRHAIFFGGTGSGKSRSLMCLGFNFMTAGGSLFWSDAKADIDTPQFLAWLCKRTGREDDMLMLVFIKPRAKDPRTLSYQTTNTTNPCTDGTVEEISNMGLSLLPDMGDGGGSNQSFAENARVLVRALTSALVDLRDSGHIALSWDVFRENVTLPNVLELAKDTRLGEKARRQITQFASQVAGVNLTKDADKQDQMAYNQFGFIASYTLPGLAKLTDDFDYVYGARYGDVAYRDAVFRGRSVFSFIPAMQNTPEEVKMLGKIDLVGKRTALGLALPDRVEGTMRSLLKKRINNGSIVPSLAVADEYQEINVEGNSVSVKQGRSLGYSNIVSTQNVSGLGSDEEKNNYLENTDLKFIGRNKGSETVDEMLKGLSQIKVSQSEGRTTERTILGTRQKETTTYNDVDRIDKKDVQSQIEGEFHAVINGQVIRIEMPYLTSISDRKDWDFPEQASVVLNTFIQCDPILVSDIASQDIASTVYSEFVNGDREITCDRQGIAKEIGDTLGNGRRDHLSVIESIMVEREDLEEDEWLKENTQPVKPQSSVSQPQSAPTVDQLKSQSVPPKESGSQSTTIGQATATQSLDLLIHGTTEGMATTRRVDGVAINSTRKIHAPNEKPGVKQLQLFDKADDARKADEAARRFKAEVGTDDAFDIEMDKPQVNEGKIMLVANKIFQRTGQMLGLTSKEMDPGVVGEVYKMLEERIEKESVENRQDRVDHHLKQLGIFSD